jgi:signal transduction histidine kinase
MQAVHAAAPSTRANLKPPAADALVAAVLAVGMELQLLLGNPEGSLALNLVCGLFLTAAVAWRRRAPVAVLAAVLAIGITNEALGGFIFTFPEQGQPASELPPFASLLTGMLAFYSVGAFARERTAAISLSGGIAGLWVIVLVSDQTDLASFLWSGGFIGAMPWFAGRVARSRRQRLESVEREQEQRTLVALGDERARIAREIHDVVAHSVGVIVVQAQGARAVLDRDPGRAAEALEQIEATARTALGDMRRSLGLLRSDAGEIDLAPQPGVRDIDALLAEARATGLDVDLRVVGEARPLPQAVDLSAYRIVQEALTNSIKHGGAAHAEIALRYGERDLEIEVVDDGRGPTAPSHRGDGAGHGLVGMRERVVALGGDLRTGGHDPAGFAVHARLPLVQ